MRVDSFKQLTCSQYRLKCRVILSGLFVFILATTLFYIFEVSAKTVQSDPIFTPATMNLLSSISKGDQQGIDLALQNGADVNETGKYGTTPIIYGVMFSDKALITGLLAMDADPNVKQDDGYNALTVAYELSASSDEIMLMLIESGKCNLDVMMPTHQPLTYYLIGNRKLKVLQATLAHGANPSVRNYAGDLLIISAALLDEFDAIQLLLDAGASPVAVHRSGRTVMDFLLDSPIEEMEPDSFANERRLVLIERLKRILSGVEQ